MSGGAYLVPDLRSEWWLTPFAETVWKRNWPALALVQTRKSREIGTRIEFEEDASQENLNALMVLLINSERPMRTVGVNMWERGGRVEIDRTRPRQSMDKTTILKLQCRTILIDKSQ